MTGLTRGKSAQTRQKIIIPWKAVANDVFNNTAVCWKWWELISMLCNKMSVKVQAKFTNL